MPEFLGRIRHGESFNGIVIRCPEETCMNRFLFPLAPGEIVSENREYGVMCPFCETRCIVYWNDNLETQKPGWFVEPSRVYKIKPISHE